MILYHAVSSYQILECIVHKVSLHKIDKAILVTREFTKNRLGSRYDLLKQIFEEIIIYGPLRDSCIDEIKAEDLRSKTLLNCMLPVLTLGLGFIYVNIVYLLFL